jgi:predicted metal-binding protein
MDLQHWIDTACDLGFTHAAALDAAALVPRADVRAMCAGDKCGAYGKNWTCPPHCGSLEACTQVLSRYGKGILVQTVGTLAKTIDTRGMRRAEEAHLARFYALVKAVKASVPDALCLGSGGCRLCPSCAYPEPCRFPELACPSMEGYGLFVTQVCRDSGLAYHHGEKTVTFTACVLFPLDNR